MFRRRNLEDVRKSFSSDILLRRSQAYFQTYIALWVAEMMLQYFMHGILKASNNNLTNSYVILKALSSANLNKIKKTLPRCAACSSFPKAAS